MPRRVLLLIVFLLLLIPIMDFLPVTSASSSGWLQGWRYRRVIIIDNTRNANTLTNYQVLIIVDTASLINQGKMRPDCSDIRFTDSDGVTLLPYWIEDETANTPATRIWVKIPSIPASSTKTIFMYYNSTVPVSSASDGASTFIMFSKSLFPVWTFSTGGYHSCALKSDGTVWCWGWNNRGQLGDGTTTDRYTPVQVVNLTNVVSIAAGAYHTCALKSDGTVWCWGYNEDGELGDGTTTNRHTPVQVSGLTSVVSIAAGDYHSCALKSDGTVWCWGYNYCGELGDGTTTKRLTPVQVSGLTSVVSIAAGGYHTCALKSDGTVWCWGNNEDGELGDGTTTDRHTPVQVSGLTSVVSITAGGYHTCALKSDGTVWCWGYNEDGELGDGTTTNRHTPVQVVNLTNVVSIAAGGLHSCALKSDGTVWCWGYNYDAELGDGTTTNRLTPVQTLNYNLGGRYDKTNTIYSVPKYTVDDFFVRSFADPEPTTTVDPSEQSVASVLNEYTPTGEQTTEVTFVIYQQPPIPPNLWWLLLLMLSLLLLSAAAKGKIPFRVGAPSAFSILFATLLTAKNIPAPALLAILLSLLFAVLLFGRKGKAVPWLK